MRRSLLGLMVALGFTFLGSDAHAQVLNDPFFAYYSFYLPRQQAQALQPGPEATLNAVAANRQFYAATNRNGMFDPNSASNGSLDFGDDFTTRGNASRRTSGSGSGRAVHGGNLNGLGPQGYYAGRLNGYFPGIKSGRGRNANIPTIRTRGFSGGAVGGGGGLPGPR